MFKFLRKYNTWILAVGGTLLMIAFLIPQAIQSCAQRSALGVSISATVGADNRKISPVEWSDVQEEVNALQQMSRALGNSGLLLDPVVGEINDPDRWFLLTYEAEQAGLVANRPPGLSEEQLNQTALLFQIPTPIMARTYAKISAVNTLIGLYRRSTIASDNRAKRFAERLMHEAVIQTVVVDASAENTNDQPTEAEIKEQFEQYKDAAPGEGEHGFGYKLPIRVKLEWLEIPAEPIRESVANSERMNGIALRRHWRENENQRGIPPVVDGGDIPSVVREDLLNQLTTERLNEVSRYAYDQLRLRQQQLEQVDGQYLIPEDWSDRRLGFPELAELVRERFEIDLPKYEAVGDRWVPIMELSDLGRVAAARTDRFGRMLNIQGMLSMSPEFGGDGTANIQTRIAGPPLTDSTDQSVYLFRLTDSDLARVPHDVDEVRDEVVEDLRRLKSYEALIANRDAFEQKAETNGLIHLAMENDTTLNRATRVALYNPQGYQIQKILRQQGQGAFDVRSSPIPGLRDEQTGQDAQDDEAMAEIIDYTMEFDPSISNFDTVPATERVFTVGSDEHLALVIVRLMQQRPLSQQRYQTMVQDGDLDILLISDAFAKGETIRAAFTKEALIERHNFQRTGTDEDANGEASDEMTTVADASE